MQYCVIRLLQRMQRMARRLASSTQSLSATGGFMGLESSAEDSDQSDVDLEKGDPAKPLDKVVLPFTSSIQVPNLLIHILEALVAFRAQYV